MKFYDIVVTANRNLLRSKLRTVFTVLAIFVGGFTLTLTTALSAGANQYLDRQLGNVSVPGVFEVMPKTDFNPLSGNEVKEYDPQKKSSSMESLMSASMTAEDVDKLAKVEGVESATPYYTLAPEYIRLAPEGSKKFGVTQLSQNLGLNLDLSAGRLPTDADSSTIVLSEEYLPALGLSAEGAVNQPVVVAYRDMRGQLVEKQFIVVGTMRKTFVTANQLFTDINSAKEIADAQGQGARYMVTMVKFKDANNSTDETVLKNRLIEAGNYSAVSLKERVGNITSIVSAITAGLNVVGIIALVAASFGIINTLLMSVYERTQEIGLMKALGMRRRKVFGMFAIEAALVGFWGSLVAVGAASLASIWINGLASSTFLKDFDGFTLLVVTPGGAAFVILLIMLIAFVAGTFPAIKASRLNPIEALRSE